MNVGAGVGECVGESVGESVGELVGKCVGPAVGLVVAAHDLSLPATTTKPSRHTQLYSVPLLVQRVVPLSQPCVLSSQGCSVGMWLGACVGANVGVTVGSDVGAADGLGVGAILVGTLDGA